MTGSRSFPRRSRPRCAGCRCTAGPSQPRRRGSAPPSIFRASSVRPSSAETSSRHRARSCRPLWPTPRSSSWPRRRGRSSRATRGGPVLDGPPPRFKRKGGALADHLRLLETAPPAKVVEEHLRHAGAAGLRAADPAARTPLRPQRLPAPLQELQQAQAVTAVDREWYVHREASDRLRSQTLALLEVFHRQNPLRGGISREELRSRAGHAQEKIFAQLLAALEADAAVRSERAQVRLASHAIRLTPEQRRVVEGLEAIFLAAGAAPPGPEEALGRLGVKGTEKHELFQLLVADRRLLRVKESLFFHAAALGEIQDKVVAHLQGRKKK